MARSGRRRIWHVTVERDGDEAASEAALEAVVRALIVPMLQNRKGRTPR